MTFNKEQMKVYNKEYYQRPEVKERMSKWFKEYNQKPEPKAKRLARQAKYRALPGNKEKLKIYSKLCWQRVLEKRKEVITNDEKKI